MNEQHAENPSKTSTSMRYLPLLCLLFVLSGGAALIYEVVWFELLELVIGSSTISVGVLLATFMGGMCIGSIGLSHVISARRNPLLIYALLESGIGILSLGILFGLPHLAGIYMFLGMKGTAILLCRGMLCGICLLLPTMLMGATLPAIARCVEATPTGMSWLGFFYGANTAGAVLGSLLAGFYLLRVHDVAIATYVAVAINLLVALAALLLTVLMPHSLPIEESERGDVVIPRGSWAVLVTISLSGMTALAAEVVWTRLLALMLGATVYTFSLILAAFLLGLGIGSGIGSILARIVKSPRAALAWCQFLLMGGIAWAGLSLVRILPFWPAGPAIWAAPVGRFLVDFAKSAVVALPAACLWGASFPLALAAAVSRRKDPGRLVGAVYAANTTGAIIGALGTSLLVVGWIGTQGAQRAMIVLAAAGALLLTATVASTESRPRGSRAGVVLRMAAATILAVWLAGTIRPVPGLIVAYGWDASRHADVAGEFLYIGEGMNSSLAVTRLPTGVLNYHNAGKIQASGQPRDMRLQRMLGHLTTLVPERPRSVLVIGCGAGVTAGAVSIDPAVERVTIAEIERLVPQVVSAYFSRQNFDVIRNPKVRLEIDDARHYVTTTREKFDAITSDPFDPWVKGAATLYTKEFFILLKQHLNPGGAVTVFVQLYQSNAEAVKSQFATFFEVFPNGTVWLNTEEGQGYDVVLLGQVESTRIDLELMQHRLSRPEYAPVVLSLAEVEFYSAEDLFSTFGGLASDLKPWLQDAQINRDRNLRLQYLAGLAIGLQRQDAIYREFVKYRRFPESLFFGSPERLFILKAKIDAARW